MLVEGMRELFNRFLQTQVSDVFGEIALKMAVLSYYDQLIPPYAGEDLNMRKGVELLRESHRRMLLQKLYKGYIEPGNLGVDPREIVKQFLVEDLKSSSK